MHTTNYFLLLTALRHHLFGLFSCVTRKLLNHTALILLPHTWFVAAVVHILLLPTITAPGCTRRNNTPSLAPKPKHDHDTTRGRIILLFGRSKLHLVRRPAPQMNCWEWWRKNNEIGNAFRLVGWMPMTMHIQNTHTHPLKHTDCCYWWSWFCCCCNGRFLNEIGVVGGVDTFCCLHRRWPRWSPIV